MSKPLPGVTPPLLASVDPNQWENAFEDAMKPGKIWYGTKAPPVQPMPTKLPPSPAVTALAEKIFMRMFEKQDSIICEPDELAERAWALAEAFAASIEKRS